MPALRALFAKRSNAALLLTFFLAAAAWFGRAAARLEPDPNPFAVLPADAARTFQEIAGRYGALDVAIVGLDTSAAGDAFTGDFLARLKTATKELNETPGVASALSMTSVEDTVEDEKGGAKVDYLVSAAPQTDAEREALRKKVLSRDLVVGNLVSADLKGVVIYCFLSPGGDTRALGEEIRRQVDAAFPNEGRHYFGAPYLAPAVLEATAKALKQSAPIGAVILLVLLALSARSIVAPLAGAIPAGVGAAVAMGAAQLAGLKQTPLLGQAPLVVAAVAVPLGLAVAVACENGEGSLPERAARAAPTVLGAGLGAAAIAITGIGIDHVPLRIVARLAALGIAAATLAAILAVPSVYALLGAATGKTSALAERLAPSLGRLAEGRRSLVVACVLLALSGAFLGRRARTDADGDLLFAKDSEPARAEAFLLDKLGGSQFVQVEMTGDMRDPLVLRELVALADAIEAEPHVSRVDHVGAILAKVSATLTGEDRLPDSEKKLVALYRFLEGRAAVRQFLPDDRFASLMQVKLDVRTGREIAPVLARIEELARGASLGAFERVGPRSPRWEEVGPRLEARRVRRFTNVAKRAGLPDPGGSADALAAALGKGGGAVPAKPILAYLSSDECTAELPESTDVREKVAAAIGALDPRDPDLRAALEKALGPVVPADAPMNAQALAKTLQNPMRDLLARERARAAVEGVLGGLEGDARARAQKALVQAALDTDVREGVAHADSGPSLEVKVTGQPSLDAALSALVRQAHVRYALGALVVGALVAFAFFRSARAAGPVLAIGGTLGATYGIASFGLRLDLATTVVPLLAGGAALVVSLAAAARARELAVGAFGGALGFAGFFVPLAMASAPTLRGVGALATVALGAAAALGLVLGSAFADDAAPRQAKRRSAS